jgi:hypothetical protein
MGKVCDPIYWGDAQEGCKPTSSRYSEKHCNNTLLFKNKATKKSYTGYLKA